MRGQRVLLRQTDTAQKAAEQEQRDPLAALPLDVNFPEMTREQKVQFKGLNADSVKHLLRKRADWLRQHPPVLTDTA